jgi:predicted metal-dependent enzyme (double-stranded beta helix superfamily)
MPDTLNAAELRRWAMECGARAYIAGCTADESTRLLKMRESLLALAENADWLNGKHADLRLSTAAE